MIKKEAHKTFFSDEQVRAMGRFGEDLAVSAGAGSGKTMLLVERFLNAVTKEGIDPEKVLAITFTEKAAHEMKLRVVREAEKRGLGALRQRLENASIGTIHSFCARILRENPIESGIDPFFQILSEGETEILLNKTLDRLFEEETAHAAWIRLLTDLGETPVREALKAFYDLSRSAAEEKEIFQVRDHGPERKKALKDLNDFLKAPPPDEKIEGLVSELAAALAACGDAGEQAARVLETAGKLDRRGKKKEWVLALQALVERWALFALEEATRPAKKEFLRVFFRFRELYEAEKNKRAVCDFDDLVYRVYRLFSDPSPACQAALRRTRSLFARVLVDEYQDTSALQAKIIGFLKKDNRFFLVGDPQQSIYGFRHADPAVFESLEFNRVFLSRNHRSRLEILNWINHFFKGSGSFRTLEAGKNFRIRKPHALEVICIRRDKENADSLEKSRVLEARAVAARIRELVESGFTVEGEEGERRVRFGDFAVLLKNTTSSHFYEKELWDAGVPTYAVKGKGFYEKPEIVDLLGVLRLLVNPEDDIALAGVLRSPLVGLSDDALFWLAHFAKSEDHEAPLSGALGNLDAIPEISEEDRAALENFNVWISGLRDAQDKRKISALIGGALEVTRYEAKILTDPEGKQKLANVIKFIEVATALEEKEVMGVGDFLRFVSNLSENEFSEAEARIESGAGDVVVISTVHAAKGLEFPCVVVADMGAEKRKNATGPLLVSKEEGVGMKWVEPLTREKFRDYAYSRIEARLAEKENREDARVLYVAMTRAKEHLILSGSVPAKPHAKDSTWMEKVMAVVGAGSLDAPEIECGGVRIKIIPESQAAAKKETPASRPSGWNELRKRLTVDDSTETIDTRARLATVIRPYTHTQDLTVTDVLVQSLEGQAKEAFRIEEDWLAETDADEARVPRNEFGTLYHKLMEILATQRPKAVSSRLFRAPFLSALSADQNEEIKKSVLEFWGGPWGKLVREAKKCYPELPFIYKTRRGVLKGQIDLVLETKEGPWLILDYKTNVITRPQKQALAETYRTQLALYALVFGRLYGQWPSRGVLYFSHLRDTAEFTYQRPDFDNSQKMLDAAFEKVTSDAP